MSGLLGSLMSGAMGGDAGGLGDMVGNVLGGEAGELASIASSVLSGDTSALMPVILNWIQNNEGLAGALEKAKALGLEEQVQSWMSGEENMSLDPSKVTELFGADTIAAAAEKFGGDENAVTSGIAELLPEVMSKLTPSGGLENVAEVDSEIGNLLGNVGGLF